MLVYVCANILLFSIYWSDTSLEPTPTFVIVSISKVVGWLMSQSQTKCPGWYWKTNGLFHKTRKCTSKHATNHIHLSARKPVFLVCNQITLVDNHIQDVYCWLYGLKSRFRAPLTCCCKTTFPTVHPTVYLPKWTFKYGYSHSNALLLLSTV